MDQPTGPTQGYSLDVKNLRPPTTLCLIGPHDDKHKFLGRLLKVPDWWELKSSDIVTVYHLAPAGARGAWSARVVREINRVWDFGLERKVEIRRMDVGTCQDPEKLGSLLQGTIETMLAGGHSQLESTSFIHIEVSYPGAPDMSISNIPDCARRWPCGRTVAHMNSSAIIWTLAISDDLAGINSPWADVVAQADPQRIRTVCVVVGEHINSFSMGGVFTAAPTGRLPLDIGRGLYAVMSPELAFDEDAEWEERYCAQEWPWKHVEDRETLGLRKLMSKLEEICRGPLQQRTELVNMGTAIRTGEKANIERKRKLLQDPVTQQATLYKRRLIMMKPAPSSAANAQRFFQPSRSAIPTKPRASAGPSSARNVREAKENQPLRTPY